jgi:hypothetical protein
MKSIRKKYNLSIFVGYRQRYNDEDYHVYLGNTYDLQFTICKPIIPY